jgi:DNA invertase Pin-like site-specific DNA recombinase
LKDLCYAWGGDRYGGPLTKNRAELQMTTSAIYGSVSTAQHHTENQLMELRAYADRNGWPFLEYLEDATAMQRGRRPALARLLKDAKAGKFQMILCWKMGPLRA